MLFIFPQSESFLNLIVLSIFTSNSYREDLINFGSNLVRDKTFRTLLRVKSPSETVACLLILCGLITGLSRLWEPIDLLNKVRWSGPFITREHFANTSPTNPSHWLIFHNRRFLISPQIVDSIVLHEQCYVISSAINYSTTQRRCYTPFTPN